MCFTTISWEKSNSESKINSFRKNKVPVWVEIDVTSKCNLNCLYCYNKINKEYQKPKSLTIKDFKEILSILKKQKIKQVTLGGGEPLLHPNIVDFVKMLTKNNIKSHIISNGYLLTKELAQKLKNAGLSQIQMNIDSLKRTKHDMLRGKKSSFDKVMKAFKNAKDFKIPCVAQTVVNNNNKNEIFDIFDYSRKIGIQRSRVWEQIPINMCKNKSDEKFFKSVINYAKKNNAKSIISYGHKINGGDIPTLNMICPPSLGMFYCIGADKNIYFCSVRKDMKLMDFEKFKLMTSKDIYKMYKEKVKEIDKNSYCAGIINNG